jgi:ABC-type transport system involved in multi-copper enzyme maturation permease subunit
MKRSRSLFDALAPWAGLVIGLTALGVVHQYGSDGVFDDCQAVSPGPLLIVAFLGFLACAGAALTSWRSMHGSSAGPSRVIAIISVGSAILFAFAILLAMIAALVLPPCFQ